MAHIQAHASEISTVEQGLVLSSVYILETRGLLTMIYLLHVTKFGFNFYDTGINMLELLGSEV